jgi:hypothetical protein
LCPRSRELRGSPALLGPLAARGPFWSRIHRRVTVRASILFLLLDWVVSRGQSIPFSCRTRSAEGSGHARRWVPTLLVFPAVLLLSGVGVGYRQFVLLQFQLQLDPVFVPA